MKTHGYLFVLAVIAIAPVLPDGPRAQQVLWTGDGQQAGEWLGFSVSGAGDVDGDGAPDWIMGAPEHRGVASPRGGRAFVYSSSRGDVLWSWESEAAADNFGIAVAGAGDTDGDGLSDLIVGAWFQSGPADSPSRRGKVYVYSGATGALLRSREGEEDGVLFGGAVSSGGDVDGDGLAEVLAGARYQPDGGRAYVYSLAPPPWACTWSGGAPGDRLGFAVDSAGDVDGDGHDDLVLGAPGVEAVYVTSCSTGQTLRTWEPIQRSYGGAFGAAVAGVGDADGDEVPDVLVGDPFWRDGEVHLYSGGLDGDPLWSAEAEGDRDRFGQSVAGGGDFDGDGLGDAVVGAPLHDGPAGVDAGRVYVVSGLTGAPLWTFDGERAVDMLGSSVAVIDDVDGDGRPELLVGAYGHDGPAGPNSGRVYLLSGSPAARTE